MLVNRVSDWEEFNEEMLKHIKEYCDFQYGNKDGDEEIDKLTSEECIERTKKYFNRRGKNYRGTVEELRDLLKIGHWIQCAWIKIRRDVGISTLYPTAK